MTGIDLAADLQQVDTNGHISAVVESREFEPSVVYPSATVVAGTAESYGLVRVLLTELVETAAAESQVYVTAELVNGPIVRREVEARQEEPRVGVNAFSYARTVVTDDPEGSRPYLILVRQGWCSVVRFDVVSGAGHRVRAPGVAREFYQRRLLALPEELQARFYAQIQEIDDPDALLARVVESAHLPRLEGVDWSRVGKNPVVRTQVDLIEDGYEPQVGDRVLLAGDTFWDVPAVVERIDRMWVVCRRDETDT